MISTTTADAFVCIRSQIREAIARATDCRTGKRLARAVGVAPGTVRAWRQGARVPGGAELIAAMAACDELHAEIEAMIQERKALIKR